MEEDDLGDWILAENYDELLARYDRPNIIAAHVSNVLAMANALTDALGEVERLREAGQAVIDHTSRTYRSANGKQCSIEADDGEACEIVHSDAMHHLRAALKGAET